MGKPRQKAVTGSTRKSSSSAVKTRPEKSQKPKVADRNNGNSHEESSNPQTCCSNCQTVFEVSLELLSTSDTRVRCGECLSIFDALANLRDITPDEDMAVSYVQEKPASAVAQADANDKPRRALADQSHNDTTSLPSASAAALAGLANDTSSLDVTYSDFDLFSSDAGLPDVHFFDNTRHTPDFHFDDVADLDDETFSDTLFAQDVTVDARSILPREGVGRPPGSVALGGDVGFITDDSKSEPLIFNYRDEKPDEVALKKSPVVQTAPVSDAVSEKSPFDEPIETPAKSIAGETLEVPEPASSSWLLRGSLFAIVVIIAGSLYGYREREALFNNSSLRPLLSSACDLLSCQLPAQVDLDALRAVDRSVVMHPTVPNALVIKFGIVNQASFSQPYPVLEIRLTDRAGRLVVINRFLPSEYLRGWQLGDVLDIGKRLDIGLAVVDPGNTAISFELDFHEVK